MDPHDPPPDPRPDRASLFTAPDANPTTIWHASRGDQPGCLSPDLARLLLDSYTQPGDLVIDVDDDVAFAATAVATGRRHYAVGKDAALPDITCAAGYIDLILLHWPRAAVDPHLLLQDCRDLLRTTGHLVIVIRDVNRRSAHLAALVGAALTAGLLPIRHIVAVARTPHTDLLIFKSDQSTAD